MLFKKSQLLRMPILRKLEIFLMQPLDRFPIMASYYDIDNDRPAIGLEDQVPVCIGGCGLANCPPSKQQRGTAEKKTK